MAASKTRYGSTTGVRISNKLLDGPTTELDRIVGNPDGATTRKATPTCLKKIIQTAGLAPALAVCAASAGIVPRTLRIWLKASERGGAGDAFDVKLPDGSIERFHNLFLDAFEKSRDGLISTAYAYADGRIHEILQFQGRVVYKIDPKLTGLGLTGESAYLRDDIGNPVPETVPLQDPEMVRWLLSRELPDRYGNKMQVEHEHRGGVLVVGATMTPKQIEKSFGGSQPIQDVEFEEIPGEPPPVSEEGGAK